jgi:type II secretory pathway pseudopilin PulG
VLSIVCVVIFIAMPTLQPSQEEATIETAKEFLAYLHGQEQAYFGLYGKYVPFKTIAEDKNLGGQFDQRFAVDQPEVEGIKFAGPQNEGAFYEIIALLPDGTRYSVTTTGEINAITIPVQ